MNKRKRKWNPFRPLAVFFVTAWARKTWKEAVRKADERYKKEHTMIYVASQPFEPNTLTTYSGRRFKIEKRVFGYHARTLSLQTLKNGCYYHTPDTAGNQAMTPEEIERRRQFFIRERLEKARLV